MSTPNTAIGSPVRNLNNTQMGKPSKKFVFRMDAKTEDITKVLVKLGINVSQFCRESMLFYWEFLMSKGTIEVIYKKDGKEI